MTLPVPHGNDPSAPNGSTLANNLQVGDLPIQQWLHLPEVDSTNSYAKSWCDQAEDLELPLLVTCDQQTAGRGRGNNQWSHRSGNLAFSIGVLKHPTVPPQWLPIWTAVCLHRTASRFLPDSRVAIKWPNDLYIEGRKNAGILIESAVQSRVAVVGVGINLLAPHQNFADGVFHWSETGKHYPATEVLETFLREFLLLQFVSPSAQQQLLQYFDRHDWLKGKQIQLNRGDTILCGEYVGLCLPRRTWAICEARRPRVLPWQKA